VGITIGLLVVWPYAGAKGSHGSKLETNRFLGCSGGLLGGRLYYVIQQPLGPLWQSHGAFSHFWEGWHAHFTAAVLAVVITILICCKRMKNRLSGILDVTALFAVVGQFFGRIGNIINGDVIGYPTTLPGG
jgi:phosphatidylglycerol:prolipoprotein diacylglycerol transferase